MECVSVERLLEHKEKEFCDRAVMDEMKKLISSRHTEELECVVFSKILMDRGQRVGKTPVTIASLLHRPLKNLNPLRSLWEFPVILLSRNQKRSRWTLLPPTQNATSDQYWVCDYLWLRLTHMKNHR